MATFRSDKDGPDKSRRYSKSGSHTKGMSEIRFGVQEKFVLAHKKLVCPSSIFSWITVSTGREICTFGDTKHREIR
jgi:hypothetical protein